MIWIISFGMCLVLAIAFLAVFRPTLFSVFLPHKPAKSKVDPDRYIKALRGTRF